MSDSKESRKTVMETCRGRRRLIVEWLIETLRTERPTRERSDDAADIIEQLLAQQQAAPEGEQEFRALQAVLPWSAEDWNELLTRHPQQREILQKLLGQQQASGAVAIGVIAELTFAERDPVRAVEWANGRLPPVGTKLYTTPTVPADVMANAERWRMLPAFIEEFQIEYVPLLHAIDAARAAEKGTT